MKRHFFHELTPLAEKLREIRAETPQRLSLAKDVPELMEKRSAKLQRRAERARKAGQL